MNLVDISIFVFVCFCVLMVLVLFWFMTKDWYRDGTLTSNYSTLPPPPPPRKMNNGEPLFLVVYGNISEDGYTVYPLDEVLQIEFSRKTGQMRVYYKSDIGYSNRINEYENISHYRIVGVSLIGDACCETREQIKKTELKDL